MGTNYTVEEGGKIITAAGIELPTSGGTASTLDFYEEVDGVTLTLTGAITGTVNAKFTRVGRIVTLEMPFASATVGVSGPLITAVGIPTRFQWAATSTNIANGISVYNAGAVDPGEAVMTSADPHQVSMRRNNIANFTGIAGFYGFSITYFA